MASTARLLLVAGAAAAALYAYAPGNGLGTKVVDPAALPAPLRTVPAGGGDPSWCGPVVSYVAHTEHHAPTVVASGQQPANDPASLATAMAGVRGLPAAQRDWFLSFALMADRAGQVKTAQDLTASDRALMAKVNTGWTSMRRDLPRTCPATASALDAV